MSNISLEELRQYSKQLFDQERANMYGADGEPGESAYDQAVEAGFVGTEQEWLNSLKGADGRSAYEIAVDNGFVGTEQDFLDSLKGQNGKSAYELAVENGFTGTLQEFEDQLTTPPKTAYELAVEEGFVGTKQEWLDSLKGADGTDGTSGTSGKSAYELAVENGFVGTEQEWLASLGAADGGSASTAQVGDIIYTSGTVSADFLPCDGSKYLISQYPQLSSTLGSIVDGLTDEPLAPVFPGSSRYSKFGFNHVYPYIYESGRGLLDSFVVRNVNDYSTIEIVNTSDYTMFPVVSGDGKYLSVSQGSGEKINQIFDVVNNHTLVTTIDIGSPSAFDHSLSATGRYVAILNSEATDNIYIYDILNDLVVTTFSASVSKYEGMIFDMFDDDVLYVWDNEHLYKASITDPLLNTIIYSDDNIWRLNPKSVSMSYDGSLLAFGDDYAGLTFIIYLNDYEVKYIPQPPQLYISYVSISSDNRFVAFSNSNGGTDALSIYDLLKNTYIDVSDSISYARYVEWSPYEISLGFSSNSSDNMDFRLLSGYAYDRDTEFVTPTIGNPSNTELLKAYIKADGGV